MWFLTLIFNLPELREHLENWWITFLDESMGDFLRRLVWGSATCAKQIWPGSGWHCPGGRSCWQRAEDGRPCCRMSWALLQWVQDFLSTLIMDFISLSLWIQTHAHTSPGELQVSASDRSLTSCHPALYSSSFTTLADHLLHPPLQTGIMWLLSLCGRQSDTRSKAASHSVGYLLWLWLRTEN